MKASSSPRFFIYENTEVKEVSENEYHQWININWHPSHLHHSVVNGCKDEVWLGFQGHYKFCEWQNKPFNITYFVYGTDIEWATVYDEYFSSFEEAYSRYLDLAVKGYYSLRNEAVLKAA